MKKLLLYLLIFTSFNLIAQTNNYSLEFDGASNAVTFTNNTDMVMSTNSFSILTWAKTDDVNISQSQLIVQNGTCACGPILDKGYRLEFRNYGTPTISTIVGGTGSVSNLLSSTFSPTSNTWYHISLIVNRQTNFMYLYIDGVIQDSLSIVGLGDMTNPATINFGRLRWYDTGNVGQYLDGSIDDVSYWNTALDSTQIQQFMYCPPTGNEADLVGYWNFEEGIGTIANDLSANSNSGTLINSPTWSTDVPPYDCCTANPITTQPTDQTVNMGNDATFTFTDSLTAATYQWQLDAGTGYTNLSNAGQFSGTDSDSLIISTTTMGNNNTNYICIVTESANCIDTTVVANLTVIINTSISELNNSLVKLFPNPSNGIITITIAQHSNGQIILTDILGKEVLSKSFTSNEVQLNLKSLESKGTYFAKVLDIDGNVIAIRKLIYQ
jgi:hypothetical protein